MLKNVAAAFQFLTVLPLPVKTEARNLERSIPWFPLVGAVIGLATGFGYQLLHRLFAGFEPVAVILTIFIYIILTRALHLDGFMDTSDAFFSRKERSATLKIMKEPTVGSFAVLAGGIWFLVLFSTLSRLTPADHVMLHSITRFQVLLPGLFFSYPRESGTGKFFVEHVTAKKAAGAVLVLIIIRASVYLLDIPGRLRFPVYAGALVLSIMITAAVGLWAKKKIGGITGDVLGFTIEANYLCIVLFFLIAYKYI
jgi:cobalamin 5'-phosphate synthase/cobalamin synthase